VTPGINYLMEGGAGWVPRGGGKNKAEKRAARRERSMKAKREALYWPVLNKLPRRFTRNPS